MRKLILMLFIVYTCIASAQVIKGTIYSKKTKSPISFASVYFNGTLVGTTSDVNGNFVLNYRHYSSMPLTFSAIGYYSTSIIKYSAVKSLQIYLVPKEYELMEASVKSKSLVRKRKRYLALFRDEFLGTTRFAGECKILNEKDITFNYNTDKDTIKAFALKPIVVENKALGYKVTYYLDKFEYYNQKEATFFSGNILFKEDRTSESMQNQFNENRKYAYLGSKMQFFRALWSNSLKRNDFIVSVLRSRTMEFDILLKYKDIVSQDSKNNKFLKYPESLLINYSGRYSAVTFLKEYVYFDQTGYFDPTGINWTGDMSNKRIADWLPYEYSMETEPKQ